MIDLNLSIAAIEKLMQLMEKYGVEDLSADFVHLKRPKAPPPKLQPSDAEVLAKHMAPLPQEPWESVSPAAVEAWSKTGKV